MINFPEDSFRFGCHVCLVLNNYEVISWPKADFFLILNSCIFETELQTKWRFYWYA